ncbi:RHS repeat-associated core domain-containing protein [Pseudomonas alkylphenolica]|uniref:Nematicidal protein 2 n=1 Tax=Pseudomonas alkylphenolica TaxID=237609 RepID=A0A077F7D3_9PSED|nr:RHS repeat-associated core domain-containing protein [Pseudomonas alkylphenolica]AIL61452.1 nematicidal protein 2 [Pseudomonas alkylphenolica]
MSETGDGGKYQAGTQTLSSFSRSGSVTTLASDAGAAQGTEFKAGLWQHRLTASLLPGQQRLDETTPRSTNSGRIWQTLRGQTVATLRADGHWQRVFSDHQDRPLRSWHDHEDVLYRHDDQGRLVERRVHAKRSGAQWQVSSEHDVFGQETLRTFSHNGQAVFAQQLEWRGDGQLLAKHSRESGALVRSEQFTYDALDRLTGYTCTAADARHRPCDDQGKAVKAQRFTWDALSNLQTCITTYSDDKTRTQTFAYDASNPTRLKSVTADKQVVEVKHNGNGYLTEDGKTRKLTYNAGGQLTQVSDTGGSVLARYAYDGYQRLAAQYVAKDKSTCELRYAGDTLIGEDWFDADGALSRQRSISPGLAEYEDNTVSWLIDDPQCGVAGQYSDAGLQLTPLLPFGAGKATTGISLGYNGMRRDPVTGSYHAGNGYRCYDPCLYRHAQPDWLSPFGEGGINDYVHCPDPVNLHDPSGAIMISRWGQSQMLASLEQSLRDTQPFPVGDRWRRIGTSAVIAVVGIAASVLTGGTASMLVFAALTALSVVSLGLEVASIMLEDSNPELSKKLSTASVVVGVLSIGNFVGAFKQAASVLRTAVTVAARMARNALRSAWKTLLVWGSNGFVRTGRYVRAASKAAKASQASAKALTAAKQAKVTDVLGDLVSHKLTVVESDGLQKMLTGKKLQVLTGWKAKVQASVTHMPESAKWFFEAVDTGVTKYVVHGGAKEVGLGFLPA